MASRQFSELMAAIFIRAFAFQIYKFSKKITNILKIRRSQIPSWIFLPSVSSLIVKIYTWKQQKEALTLSLPCLFLDYSLIFPPFTFYLLYLYICLINLSYD